MTDWKPCPFCGSEPAPYGLDRRAFEGYQETHGKSILQVWCINPECYVDMSLIVPEKIPYEEALERLKEKWNRRTE